MLRCGLLFNHHLLTWNYQISLPPDVRSPVHWFLAPGCCMVGGWIIAARWSVATTNHRGLWNSPSGHTAVRSVFIVTWMQSTSLTRYDRSAPCSMVSMWSVVTLMVTHCWSLSRIASTHCIVQSVPVNLHQVPTSATSTLLVDGVVAGTWERF